MAEQVIVIDVDVDGSVRIEGQGFVGPECKHLTKAIEDALGEVTSVKKTSAYHESKPLVRKVGS